MANIICWMCKNNLSFLKYEGTKCLDDDGSKACYECLLEADAFDEEEDVDEFGQNIS